MQTVRALAHFLVPAQSNNQKAKLLHSSSLTLLTLLIIFYQIAISFLPRIEPSILGYAANISPSEVIRLTNEKRAQAGLSTLEGSSVLSEAAQAKAADMINKDYWAHVAPDGTQPWKFFTDFGYNYKNAGENLARDFSNPAAAVEAWMGSPSHKENMLSPKYKEIGIAVIEGDLAGVDTTIIVQFFGTRLGDAVSVPVAAVISTPVSAPTTAQPTNVSSGAPTSLPTTSPPTSPPTSAPNFLVEATPENVVASQKVMVSPFNITKGLSLGLVGVLLTLLVIDGIVVAKRRVFRIGGRTFAHLAFLGMILAISIILKAGQIL